VNSKQCDCVGIMGDNNIFSDLCRMCQEIRKTCESIIKLQDVMISTHGPEIGDDIVAEDRIGEHVCIGPTMA